MKWENVVIAINYDLESFIAMKLEMTLIIKIMNMMLILLKFFINSYYSVYNITWYLTLLYIFSSWTSALTKRQRCSSILPLNPWTWTSSSRQTRPWQNQATIRNSNHPPCSNPTLLLDHLVCIFSANNKPCHKSTLAYISIIYAFITIAFRKHDSCYW